MCFLQLNSQMKSPYIKIKVKYAILGKLVSAVWNIRDKNF